MVNISHYMAYFLVNGMPTNGEYTTREVKALFNAKGGGCLSFSKENGEILFRALSKLPSSITDWSMEKLVFLSSLDDYNAYIINMPELVDRGKIGIVVLCELLKCQPPEMQAFTIAHEIAHVKLKHSTAFPDLHSIKQCESRDEKDADELANAWLSIK